MKRIISLFLLLWFFTLCAELKLNGVFNWNDSAVITLENGVLYCSMEFNEPRIMKLSVVRIDLANPKLRFKITGKSELWGKPMTELPQFTIQTDRLKSRKFMENARSDGENMLLAINGAPWLPWQKPWNHPHAEVRGLLVSDGIVVAPPDKPYPSFIVRKDGSCDFAEFDKTSDISDIKQAMSGFGFVLRQGKISVADNNQLAPRTGYGLSADRRYLYLLVIDGRQELYSMGSSTFEVGQLLKFLGAADGVNMDGGGSTTLLIYENNKIKKLNHHKNDAERTVAATMGIIIDK